MDIQNAIVSSNFARSIQENRQVKPQQEQRTETPSRRSANGSTDIDSEELVRRGTAIEASRVQRLDNTESASFRTRRALESYEQSVQAAQDYEQGQLVGVDLFV